MKSLKIVLILTILFLLTGLLPLSASEWVIVNDAPGESNWHISSDGYLVQDSNIYRSDKEYDFFQGTHIITGNSNWSVSEFSFTVIPTDNDGVGAIINYQDKDNYYRFIMVNDSSNRGPFRSLEKFVKGERFILSRTEEGFTTDSTYNITMKRNGIGLEVWMNGEVILSADDSTFSSGKVGFLTYACSAKFCDVKVKLPEPYEITFDSVAIDA